MDITKNIVAHRETAFLVGDHASYRAQLSRRLRIVRKKLGRATPKNAKYVARPPVTAQDIGANTEYLHLLLLTCERARAHAMAMKASHSEEIADQSITGSTRQHIISRLQKAARTAQEIVLLLSDQVASGATDSDLLEAKGYAYTLVGLREFEKQSEGTRATNASPQRWKDCLNNLAAARIIYDSFVKTTKEDLFKEVLTGTIDPALRYAAYQNRVPRTVGVPSVARKFFPREEKGLLVAVERLDPTALQEEEMNTSDTTITWRGRTANVVDAAIGQALASAHSASIKLNETMVSNVSAKNRANAYDDVLVASQDAVDATRMAIEELEKEGVAEGDTRMQDLRVTNLAVHYDLVSWRIGRDRVLIGVDDGLTFPALPPQQPRRLRKDDRARAPREEPTARKLARLRERVALYDAIIQSIDSIKDFRGAMRDSGFIAELDGQRLYFQALKCLNLSHSHALIAATRQATALCRRALSLASQASSSPRPASTTSTEAPQLLVSEQQASKLQMNLENLYLHYRAREALSQMLHHSSTDSDSQLPNNAPVVERLDEYPASGTVKLTNLVTWPPKLKPVPVKPLFLDVAFNYIEYPGHNNQSKEAEPETSRVYEPEEEAKPAKKGWFSFGR